MAAVLPVVKPAGPKGLATERGNNMNTRMLLVTYVCACHRGTRSSRKLFLRKAQALQWIAAKQALEMDFQYFSEWVDICSPRELDRVQSFSDAAQQ